MPALQKHQEGREEQERHQIGPQPHAVGEERQSEKRQGRRQAAQLSTQFKTAFGLATEANVENGYVGQPITERTWPTWPSVLCRLRWPSTRSDMRPGKGWCFARPPETLLELLRDQPQLALKRVTRAELARAIGNYQQRERRFGLLSEQLPEAARRGEEPNE